MRLNSLLSMLLACLMLVGLSACSKSAGFLQHDKLEIECATVVLIGTFDQKDVVYWRSQMGQEVFPGLTLVAVEITKFDPATGTLEAKMAFHTTTCLQDLEPQQLQLPRQEQPRERSEPVGPRLQAAR